jgi:rhamnosyltransferase
VKKVAILMATYNGEDYIEKQLKSIQSQTFHNWELFVRDDNSSDSTIDIIEKFVSEDKRIHLINSNSPYHGAFINFHYLINEMRKKDLFDFYYFADQDDIWDIRKLELMNHAFNNKGIPELIYSDMTIIDENDEVLIESNHQDRGIVLPNKTQLYFTHSYIWGCATAFNKELFQLVPKIDIEENIGITSILSHDNFFAKFALEYGKVTYLDECLIMYRRHLNNVSKISKSTVGIKDAIKGIFTEFSKMVALHANGYSQTLFMIDHARKNGLEKKELNNIESVIRQGGLKSVAFLRKNNVKKNQFLKTTFMYFILLTGRYKKYLKY